jgi:hypothetical protein
VSTRPFHRIWIEQCDAAEQIKVRYGVTAAFDYLVAEKLLNFASAARRYPEFARDLPSFVARVRRVFASEELRTHLARIEREQRANDVEIGEDDEREEAGLLRETPDAAAERALPFAAIRDLLTAAELGIS